MADNIEKNIVLNAFLQPGDVVVVNNSEESKHWIKCLPDGTELTCIGFTQYLEEIHYGDVWEQHPERGVYLQYGAAIYRGPDDQILTYSAHDVRFKDESIDPQKTRRDTYIWKMHYGGVRLSDLPSYEFEIDDVVSFKNSEKYSIMEDPNFVRAKIAKHAEPDREGMRVYEVQLYVRDRETPEEIVPAGNYPFVREDELELVSRGNFYKHTHGEEPVFTDLREKVRFYTMLGKSQQLRRPEGSYVWDKDVALQSIKDGYGCCLRVAGGLFGTGPSLNVYAFPELPELEAELRQATIEGFDL